MSEPSDPPVSVVEFLTARLDEDEQAARAVKPLGEAVVMGGERHPETFGHMRYTVASADGYPRTLGDPDASRHFARHDPTVVLVDIAAKRAIIAEHTPAKPSWPSTMERGCRTCATAQIWDSRSYEANCRTMCHLASIYSDHPDYREEWRPA